MPSERYDHLLSANRELRNFLERVDALTQDAADVDASDLRALHRLVDAMAPEICKPSIGDIADAALQSQIQEYRRNLRALQTSLEQVRSVMLARRAQIEIAREHVDHFQNWADAYQQTA